MKKSLLALCAVLALSSTAFARDAALVGTWNSQPMPVGGGLTLQFQVGFSADGVFTVTNTCSQGATSVRVSAHGTYDTNGNILSVSGNDSQEAAQNGVTCNVAVTTDAIPYSVTGSMLQLTKDGQSLLLSKSN